MVLYDLETIQDLGLDRCDNCYGAPSTWVSTSTPQDYLTKIIPSEILDLILLYAVRPEGGSQPVKADVITGRIGLVANNISKFYRPNSTLVVHHTFTALSLTNRRLKADSTKIFFGKNRFYFHECTGMYIYLNKISPEQRQLITEVIFV
jgi:hypothetical protein